MVKLPIDLNTFGFVTRERDQKGRIKKNRCGRDALYYVFHYYFPDVFSPGKLNPEKIERERFFGFKILDNFPAYSGTALNKVPQVLRKFGITTEANGRLLAGGRKFLSTCLFREKRGRLPFVKLKQEIISLLNLGIACVIDLPAPEMGFGMNHVMFIYGIDDGYLYVIDTWKLECFEYEKIGNSESKYLMKFAFKDIVRRWNLGGVLWVFKKDK